MLEMLATIQECAPTVNQYLMLSLVSVESSHNPHAIGVVNGRLRRQPNNLEEAKATAAYLEKSGYNYSLGYAQVNKVNFNRFNLNLENAFDPCLNIKVGSQILTECYARAIAKGYKDTAVHKALSCYYTGQLNSGEGSAYANKVIARFNKYINSSPKIKLDPNSRATDANTNQSEESAVVF